MSDYYINLCDINFFSGDSYQNKLNKEIIQTDIPGKIKWETWSNGGLKSKQAKLIFEENIIDFNRGNNLDIILKQHPAGGSLIVLSICEYAYRADNELLFHKSYNLLINSPFQFQRLKAVKLYYAYYSLKLLSDHLKYNIDIPLTRIEKLQLHALHFLNKRFGMSFNKEDIKVETPVLKDWDKRGMNFDDVKRLEDFYKTTHSYVLELLAANHQVETLFNYSIIINKLKEIGVDTIYDYAGGIGTFALLAKLNGISVIFSELDSVTRDYATIRIEDSGINIHNDIIEYDNPNLKQEQKCIICTEVLEHIYEPYELVEYFHSRLSKEGILVISESFNYTENFCTHLPKHKGDGGNKFIEYMKSLGLTLINVDYTIHPLIFIKH